MGDSTGLFELNDIPAGRIDLFVDGRTSSHLQKIWPSLHFESYIVRGQQNQLAHPIYLPPLLMTEAKVVVDIKVCAVSEVWSGLKLVVRKELR